LLAYRYTVKDVVSAAGCEFRKFIGTLSKPSCKFWAISSNREPSWRITQFLGEFAGSEACPR